MRACFCFRLRKKHSIVLLFTNIFHFIFKDFLCLFSLANDLVTHTAVPLNLTIWGAEGILNTEKALPETVSP